ncbi:hypothetical protein AcW1_007032 [Taiwanofungus camphoratus]|nr:hypothetical protein AcV7_005162 [Antrodia cinnamomea]KAI0929686.1 hypothetical protein AcV7_005162 [Antrodia cinnamomea]KAI0955449.1 hypothetical protein AcW1_007032 [Antrodia cinnamomea]
MAVETTADPVRQTVVDPEVAAAAIVSDTSQATEQSKDVSHKDEEPQNALTKKFTEDEWKAVKELRARLPDILTEAYPEKEAKSSPILLWGVSIDPTGSKDARVSVILIKFLRARNLSVNDAHKMLVDTLRWRKEFKVDEAVSEKYPSEFDKVGIVYGKDKEGRPVTYNLYGAHKDAFKDVQLFIRWRVAFMEKSIQLLDFENTDQMIQVHDYQGISMTSRDANSKAAASQATAIFQNYYPEFLSSKWFVNVPGLMAWIFWLFKPLIPAKTLAKFSMVGSGPQTIGNALLPIINAKELPKQYGGEAGDFA